VGVKSYQEMEIVHGELVASEIDNWKEVIVQLLQALRCGCMRDFADVSCCGITGLLLRVLKKIHFSHHRQE